MALLRPHIKTFVQQFSRVKSVKCFQNRRLGSTVFFCNNACITNPQIVYARFGVPRLLSNDGSHNTPKSADKRKSKRKKHQEGLEKKVQKTLAEFFITFAETNVNLAEKYVARLDVIAKAEKAVREARKKARAPENEIRTEVFKDGPFTDEDLRLAEALKEAEDAVRDGYDPIKEAFLDTLRPLHHLPPEALPGLTEENITQHKKEQKRLKNIYGNDDTLEKFPVFNYDSK